MVELGIHSDDELRKNLVQRMQRDKEFKLAQQRQEYEDKIQTLKEKYRARKNKKIKRQLSYPQKLKQATQKAYQAEFIKEAKEKGKSRARFEQTYETPYTAKNPTRLNRFTARVNQIANIATMPRTERTRFLSNLPPKEKVRFLRSLRRLSTNPRRRGFPSVVSYPPPYAQNKQQAYLEMLKLRARRLGWNPERDADACAWDDFFVVNLMEKELSGNRNVAGNEAWLPASETKLVESQISNFNRSIPRTNFNVGNLALFHSRNLDLYPANLVGTQALFFAKFPFGISITQQQLNQANARIRQARRLKRR